MTVFASMCFARQNTTCKGVALDPAGALPLHPTKDYRPLKSHIIALLYLLIFYIFTNIIAHIYYFCQSAQLFIIIRKQELTQGHVVRFYFVILTTALTILALSDILLSIAFCISLKSKILVTIPFRFILPAETASIAIGYI